LGEVSDLRFLGDGEQVLLEADPLLLGKSLVVVPNRVNVYDVEKEDLLIGQEGALLVVSGEAKGDLEIEPLEACHGVIADDGSSSPRVLANGGVQGVEVNGSVMCKGIGPKVCEPKFLKTKGGVFDLCGAVSNADNGVIQGSLGLAVSDPPGPGTFILGQVVGGSQPHPSRVSDPDRGKGGRTKKVMKKTCPYPPGNKFAKFQELCKGGSKPRRKRVVVEAHQGPDDCSAESDPIDSCEDEDQAVIQQHVCDFDGIGLEVVLSRPAEDDEIPSGSMVPCSLDGGRTGRSSGLVDLLDDTLPICSNTQVIGGLVNKDRGDAFRVIDIQKDIGMNFKGEGDEDVERSMRYEGMDREKKCDWVQGNGNQ
jgi:hypothetical protein